jgi:hypothetical protein
VTSRSQHRFAEVRSVVAVCMPEYQVDSVVRVDEGQKAPRLGWAGSPRPRLDGGAALGGLAGPSGGPGRLGGGAGGAG